MTSIVWDMGGTLFDTYPSIDHAFADLLTEHGHDIDLSEISALTRVSREHAITTLARQSAVLPSLFRDRYDEVKEGWKTSPPRLMTGALEVAKACKNSGGKNLVVTHRDRDSALQLLSTSEFVADDLISTSDGFPRKPDPAMIFEILSRNSIRASDCIAIGDRPIDVLAANSAGIEAFLLVSASVPHDSDGTTITSLTELLPSL